MEPIADARREVVLEIQQLAEEFAKDDEAAFRRNRIACWVGVAIVTIVILGALMVGGDARYLGVFWLILVERTDSRWKRLVEVGRGAILSGTGTCAPGCITAMARTMRTVPSIMPNSDHGFFPEER